MKLIPDIKLLYNSLKDDVVNEFYIKTLSYFKYYDRVSAYFDSRILELYSIGIENIVKNNGKIRFIFSHQIEEKDMIKILDGYDKRIEKEISAQLLDAIKDLSDSDNISNLSFLIANNIVDIKFALTKKGIFHDKFGLIYDDNDTVLFRGSANETYAGAEVNYDSFETTTSWNTNNAEIINLRKTDFNKLWSNKEDNVEVIDAPSLVIKKLLEYNKGQIIVTNYGVDSLILDYNNRFYVENNLEHKERLDKKNFYYRSILYYTDYETDNLVFFKDNNNYMIIEEIIDRYKKYAIKQNIKLFITNKLTEFLESRKYEINRMQSLGLVIKDNKIIEYDYINTAYDNFKKIVKKEMLRVLREPQFIGAFHLVMLKKSSNFSVPGAGKTSIVYGAFGYLNSKEINLIDRIVMIGPINSFQTWKEEFKLNFGGKKQLHSLDVNEVEDYELSLKYDWYDKNLILINYEKLQKIQKMDILKVILDNRTLLVFDEIHRIKNPEGKRANAALSLASIPTYKIVLTGTPLPNGYQDIYNILNILYTDEYKSYFKYDLATLKTASNNSIQASKINDSIYPFFIRTTKRDLGIPQPNEDDLSSGYVTMNDKEEKINRIIYNNFSDNSLLLYIRLLQASINPSTILKSLKFDQELNEMFNADGLTIDDTNKRTEISKTDYDFILNSGLTRKFYKGIELIEKLVKEGKQVLVWCVFIDTINLIHDELNKRNIINDKIYGQTEFYMRNDIIDKFKKGEIKVLISNPHTIAESVSLHKTCHDAIYFEYTFNLTHMLQSRDRINRLGLESDQYTQYYYLIMNNSESEFNSIDMKTYLRLKDKESVMIKAIEENEFIIEENAKIEEDLNFIFKNSKIK